MKSGRKAFPLAWASARLLGLPAGADADRLRAAQRGNASAKANIGRVRVLLDRLYGAPDQADVLRLYQPGAGGGLDAENWIERGELPGGGADPRYDVKAASSRKNFYTTLVMLADPDKACAEMARRVPEETRRRYRERLNQLAEEVRAKDRRNELSDREKRSILPWGTIMRLYAEKADELKPDDRLIVDFWLVDPMQFPPKRLDFGDCAIVQGSKPPPAAGNYLRVRPGGAAPSAELHLRDYKTARHYSEFVQELPPALARRVVDNLDADAAERGAAPKAARASWRKYLFQSRHGAPGPVADNTFGRQVSSAFRRLTGVAIGASNLRKSFITHLLTRSDKSQAELGEIARRMLHSEEMQRLYRRVDIGKTASKARSSKRN